MVVPQPFPLSTADVYREADRLRLSRSAEELERRRATSSPSGSRPKLIVNDLEPAALSLAPRLGETLGAVLRAGADDAIDLRIGPDRDRAVLGGGRPFTRARGRVGAARASTRRCSASIRFAEGTARWRRTNERLAAICAGSEPSTAVMTTFRHNHGCET